MIVLIPMGGFGTRFQDAGYTTNKPCIPTTDRRTGETVPMVVAAMRDIPGIHDDGTRIICVNRDFHATDGTEDAIRREFPNTVFIHDHVLLDQAFACFLARDFLMSDEPLLIGACDNGFDFDIPAFEARKDTADVIMISHSGDENIAQNPQAHSWAELNDDGETIKRISIKKTVSADFMSDHATTGMFWFRQASVFLASLERMIWEGDSLHDKHLVDRVLQYCIDDGRRVTWFDTTYFGWGTPDDFEAYQATYQYWKDFVDETPWL